MAKKYTQAQQVIDTLRAHGGYATLGNLYHLVDTSAWPTKTPNESIRRIVQQSDEIFKIQPGLWALEECREEVMRKFDIVTKKAEDDERLLMDTIKGSSLRLATCVTTPHTFLLKTRTASSLRNL